MNTDSEFLSIVANKYNLNFEKLSSLWKNKPDIHIISSKYNITEHELTELYYNIKGYNEDDSSEIMQVGFLESQQMNKDEEISLIKFGLVDIPIENIYNMRKLKMIEGDANFFLRQLINSYRFLKYHDKLNITTSDFYKVYNNLDKLTFSTKKSPLGLLLGSYIYDNKNIVNMDKFYKITKVKKGSEIDARLIIPINYIYKVYASDVVRYAKLFHTILQKN
jgi:hypothetical protein